MKSYFPTVYSAFSFFGATEPRHVQVLAQTVAQDAASARTERQAWLERRFANKIKKS